MSVLSDTKILAKIYGAELKISPLQIDHIQPSSIDLTLDDHIKVPISGKKIDTPYPSSEQLKDYFISQDILSGCIIKPGEFVLGQIKETIGLSENLVGSIQNRNSIIRLGINAGLSSYINPGYEGKLPIAIHNIGNFEFHLVPGMRICQLVLHETKSVLKDYSRREGAKYHAEQTITLSKLSEDTEFVECVKKLGRNPNTNELITFLSERISEKSNEFIRNLTPEQKEVLGLA